jgi:hypothetical protein
MSHIAWANGMMEFESVFWKRAGLARGRGFLPEHRQTALDCLPVEEVIKTGPGVDFGIAEHALEAAGIAGMLVRVLLARRGVIHPAFGAGELLSCPYASHAGNMRREFPIFQSVEAAKAGLSSPKLSLRKSPVNEVPPIAQVGHRRA